MFKLSRRSLSRLDGIHPDLILIILESIKVSPIDFGIPKDGGVRTTERQKAMFLDPDIKTNCDGVKFLSNHQIPDGEQYGKAFDIYGYINGAASWDEGHLDIIAGAILSTAKRLFREDRIDFELTWGGQFSSDNFKGWDKCHFEIK